MPEQSIPRVIVGEVDVDATLIPMEGLPPVLALREGQSFESACEEAQKVLPDLHPEVVKTLVRNAMPAAARQVALPTADTWVPGASHRSPRARRRRQKLLARKFLGSGVMLGILVCGASVGGAWWASVAARADLAAFSDARFGAFEKAMGLSCEELTALTARCTVMSGKDMGDVLIAEAEIADGHLTYKLQRGSERTFMMVFEDEDSARLWTAENADGVAPTFDLEGRPLLDPRGHYLAFGTSKSEVEQIQAALPPAGSEEQPLAEGINDLAAATMEAMPAPGPTAHVPDPGQAPARAMAPAHSEKPEQVPVESTPEQPSPPASTPTPPSTPSPESPTEEPAGDDLTTRSEEPASDAGSETTEQSATTPGPDQEAGGEPEWDDFEDWTSGDGWGDNWVAWTWLDHWGGDKPGNGGTVPSWGTGDEHQGIQPPGQSGKGEDYAWDGSRFEDPSSAHEEGGPLSDVERPVKEKSAP